FGFWILGTMTYLFPRLLGRPWWSSKLVEWHYWLSATGMLLMFLSLTAGGVFVGFSWGLLEPWFESIDVAMPYWIFRLFTGIAIYLGNILFLVNLVMTILKSPTAIKAAA